MLGSDLCKGFERVVELIYFIISNNNDDSKNRMNFLKLLYTSSLTLSLSLLFYHHYHNHYHDAPFTEDDTLIDMI